MSIECAECERDRRGPHDPSCSRYRPSLSDSLFHAVEAEQGYAFISDGLDELPDADVRAIARGSLYHSRRVVRILERWIAAHDDGSKRRMVGTGSGKARA